MAKGSGTTRSVGGSSAASGRTFNTGGSRSGYEAVGRHEDAMVASLRQFADQNEGWRNVGRGSIINTLSDTDNIRTVSIKVESSQQGDRVELFYTASVIENRTPNYESRDHDAFQRDLRAINGFQFNSIREAKGLLDEYVKRMNKMQIR